MVQKLIQFRLSRLVRLMMTPRLRLSTMQTRTSAVTLIVLCELKNGYIRVLTTSVTTT